MMKASADNSPVASRGAALKLGAPGPAACRAPVLAALLLAALVADAAAVGSVSTVSPRPMAMGGAFMAMDDEVAAMAWNPAGFVPPLCRSKRSLRAHLNILGAPAIARETGLLRGAESEPFASLTGIEKLSITLGSVVKSATYRTGGVAVGVLMLEEQLDPEGLAASRGLADASDLLGAYYTTIAFAFQLAPSARIGASEIILSGWKGGVPGERSTGTGRAYGALLRPNDMVSVGLTYLDLPSGFDDYRLVVEGLGPRTMNAGLAYTPSEGLTLTFDLRDLAERHPATSLEPRLGLEFDLWGRGALRAGAYREDGGETNVMTLGVGAIPSGVCRRSGVSPGGDSFVLNYAVLLREGGGPRHLLSVLLHF
jgi:hypothetical protein